MSNQPYFPESDNELDRLVSKTDKKSVVEQAVWAGLKPGMRVLDIGCGPGITTMGLAEFVGPEGCVIGVDRSSERIQYAQENCSLDNVDFIQRNFFDDLSDLGQFDFVWVRFVLEYFLEESFQLASHAANSVRPGGICCFADLDHNCLNYYGASDQLVEKIEKVVATQMNKNNFDPYVGRKLNTYLYDLGFIDINVDVRAHHLVFGDLSLFDRYNWWHKIEVAGCQTGLSFDEYEGGFTGFKNECKEYLSDPRRFIYTPLIIARGEKPLSD